MVGFEDPYKVVARRNAFLAFSSAWDGDETECGAESEGLKFIYCVIKVKDKNRKNRKNRKNHERK
jgi:hypothetical protein